MSWPETQSAQHKARVSKARKGTRMSAEARAALKVKRGKLKHPARSGKKRSLDVRYKYAYC